jgi:hypothetical protein
VLQGVAAVDIKVYIVEQVVRNSYPNNGYAFLLNDVGETLQHPRIKIAAECVCRTCPACSV